MQDFRDAVYYPVVAFLDGVNPYNAPRYLAAYPVAAEFPPYSPLALLVHLPFGLMPFRVAELAYFGCCVAMIVPVGLYRAAVVWASKRRSGRVFALAAPCSSRGRLMRTCSSARSACKWSCGSFIALEFAKRRPWIAGLGLGLATLKPTFGVPLALILLCRRDFRAVLWGIVFGGAGGAIAFAMLAWRCGGVSQFVAAVWQSYSAFASETAASPVAGTMRCDAVAVLARLSAWDPGPGRRRPLPWQFGRSAAPPWRGSRAWAALVGLTTTRARLPASSCSSRSTTCRTMLLCWSSPWWPSRGRGVGLGRTYPRA